MRLHLLHGDKGDRLVVHLVAILAAFFALAPSLAAAQTQLIARSRLDEAVAAPNHVRILYAVPVDGWDRILDMNGTLQEIVETMQAWMAERADGMRVRIRTIDGRPEILFVRLALTQDKPDDVKRTGPEGRTAANKLVRDIDEELRRRTLIRENEVFAVFYDGIHFGQCGLAMNSAIPAKGTVVLVNLLGTFLPTGVGGCSRVGTPGTSQKSPLGLSVALLHEVFHALGAVPDCAPDALKGTKHLTSNRYDLMFGIANDPFTRGAPVWAPREIDARRRSYFGHGRSDCLDLAKSPFLER